jgi:radical SAM-linked protein
LVRLFDRAVRRASLPVSFSGGFHPAPRIMIANALSLGYASTGEIIEFEMKTAILPSEFQQRLAAELNEEMPLYSVEEIPLQSPAATQLIHRAEYRLTVIADSPVASEEWQNWADAVQQSTEILQTQTTKSGKIREVNLRERLYELELLPVTNAAELELRYVGSCANDGTLLRPEQLVFMLEQFAGMELRMMNVVRSRLILS